MEIEEVSEEYYSAEATASEFDQTDQRSSTSADPFRDFNTRHIELLTQTRGSDVSGTKKVQLPVETEQRYSYTLNKYKKESRYRRYSEYDDDNIDDPRWSTTVKPFESSQLQPDPEDYEDEPETSLRLSFLDHFADLPTVDEISSTLSEEIIQTVEEERLSGSLLGKFVDPLTGLEISQQSFHSIRLEYEYEEYVDIDEEGESSEHQMGLDSCETLGISEDSELLELQELDVEMEKIEESVVAKPEEDVMNFEIVTKEVRTGEQTFDEALVEDTKRQNEAVVATFIDELIQYIVDTSEYKDPKEILRKTINKRKLMDEIAEKLEQLEIEQNVRLFLNRKVVEHHKRKNLYRNIIDDSPDTIEYFTSKYKEQLENYDKAMGKEAELLTVMNSKTEKLKQVLAYNEIRAREKIVEFEQIVKKTLLKGRESLAAGSFFRKLDDGRRDFPKNICTLLNKFNPARKEISETRLELIKKQHLYAELKGRLYEMQNLGNGLNLTHYENLQNEVKQLSKKNEERNSELVKARTTRVIDVHINTHMKETVLTLRNALEFKKLSYRALLRELENARIKIFRQKQLRGQIRREAKECYHQGGILSKPALMSDYDRTAGEVTLKEASIAALRSQLEKLNDKIAQYEQILSSRSKNKFK